MRRPLHTRCLAVAAVALTMLVASAAAQAPRERLDLPQIQARIVEQTNILRGRNDLPPVALDPRLATAAQRYADFMAGTERYGHEADGQRAADRVAAEGYDYCALAENIAYVFSSLGFTPDQLATRLLSGWERSPEHRRNLLLASATAIGIGVAQSPNSRRFYAVQLIAQPRSAATTFEVRNATDSAVRYDVDGEGFTLAPGVTRTHTRCSESELRFQPPVASPGVGVIRVRDRARYVVSGSDAAGVTVRAQ